jgi:TolB protein
MRGDDLQILSNRPGLNNGGALSPDGTALAVTLSFDGNSEIYLLSPTDGSIMARLTNNRAEDLEPTWSPDSAQIAYVSDQSGGPQIYVMNRDGTGQHRVTFVGRYNAEPDWSPDGTQIAFTGRDTRNAFDIFVVDVASSNIQRVTQDQGNNQSASWSPDGRYLVFRARAMDESRTICIWPRRMGIFRRS